MNTKAKIIRIEKGKEGVTLPQEFLRRLELIPGSEVELYLDRTRKWIILKPAHGEDILEHFKETMEKMA